MKGIINILKPQGISSAAAVSIVKRKLNYNCGHMGTLDPMASGVLIIGVGQASRLFDYLIDKKKTYRARFLFGLSTDTLDTTGTVDKTTTALPTEEAIKKALPLFIGKISQVPPNYSAKCVDGKRGYQLARKGVDFTLPPKEVCVYDFKYLGKTGENEYEFLITCGGGTYIRSLARDLGKAVGSLAVMSKLTRTESGAFNLENGVDLEEFKSSDNPQKYLLPAEISVNYPEVRLSNEQATKILNGVFDYGCGSDGLYKVYAEEEFWGIGQEKDGILRIKTYVR